MELTTRRAEYSDHDQLRKLVHEVHKLHVSNRSDVYAEVEDPFAFDRFQSLLVNENTKAYVVSVDHENAIEFYESLGMRTKNRRMELKL